MERRTKARLILYPSLLLILFSLFFIGHYLLGVVVPERKKQEPVFMINSLDDLDTFYAQAEEMSAGATEIKELVLVTGGSGFVCSHFVDLLIAEGYQVVVFDRVENNPVNRKLWKMKGKENVLPAFLHIHGDITNKEHLQLIPELPFSSVVHCAGEPPVWSYQADNRTGQLGAQELDNVHVQGTINLWELFESRDHKLPRFVALSTTDIYGPLDKTFLPYSKKRAPNPLNDWAKSKLKMEKFLTKSWKKKPININSVAIVRPTTIYGPRQLSHEGLVSHLVKEGLEGRKIPLPSKRFVENRRDFLFVSDLAECLLQILKYPKALFIETNIGSGEETSLQTLAEMIHRDTQDTPFEPSSDILYLDKGGEHPDVTNQRVDKKREIFLPEYPISLEEGLRRTVEGMRVKEEGS